MQAFYLDLSKKEALIPLRSFVTERDAFSLSADTPPTDAGKFYVTDMDGYLYLCIGESVNITIGGVTITGAIAGRTQLPRKDQSGSAS